GLNAIEMPLIVGLDGNHWNLRTSLELPDAPTRTDPFFDENAFFGADPDHGLRDALVAYLEAHPARHRKLVTLRPDGPLEVTHNRGGHGRPDRFDYLMISKEFQVDGITHDHRKALRAGSDHGLVYGHFLGR